MYLAQRLGQKQKATGRLAEWIIKQFKPGLTHYVMLVGHLHDKSKRAEGKKENLVSPVAVSGWRWLNQTPVHLRQRTPQVVMVAINI